ncbi:MAG: hypothetical protein VKP62_03495 [Candidatus Sericytochromatia bacterium]|nr:hypothetical protein [Candidatus Sericytochromatia bacterium]
MIQTRHPLLAIRPVDRRVLARHLVKRAEQLREEELRHLRLRGRRAGLWLLLCALVIGALWQLGPWPLGVAFQGWLASCTGLALVQALGARLRPSRRRRLPAWLGKFLGLGQDLQRALRFWRGLRPVPASRFILAAGLLLSARPQLSSTLVSRLLGRTVGPTAALDALGWLVTAGYLERVLGTPRVLTLSDEGRRLLQALGVSPYTAPPSLDVAIPLHLLPMMLASGEAAAEVEPPEETLPPSSPLAEVPASDLAPAVPTGRPAVAAQRSWRWHLLWLLPLALAFGAVLALALPAWLMQLSPSRPQPGLTLTLHHLPHSRGTVIQMSHDQRLLSRFAGDLFQSVPERLDYKKPLSFSGFDMAADCSLVDHRIARAQMSPMGRFLWVESDRPPGVSPPERCLVDLETRTVAHDLGRRFKSLGAGTVVGWVGPQALLVEPVVNTKGAPTWEVVDPLTGRSLPVAVPFHQWLLPLHTEAGFTWLAGLDKNSPDRWTLSTYWWNGVDAYQPVRPPAPLNGTFPEGLVPRRGAVSPDKGTLLLSWGSPKGVTAGKLALVTLADARVHGVHSSAPVLADAPLFWGTTSAQGVLRFYYNVRRDHGVEPWSGEIMPPQSQRRAAS